MNDIAELPSDEERELRNLWAQLPAAHRGVLIVGLRRAGGYVDSNIFYGALCVR